MVGLGEERGESIQLQMDFRIGMCCELWLLMLGG